MWSVNCGWGDEGENRDEGDLDGVWWVEVYAGERSKNSSPPRGWSILDDEVGDSSSWFSLGGGIFPVRSLRLCCVVISCLDSSCLLSLAVGTDGCCRKKTRLEVNSFTLYLFRQTQFAKMSALPDKVKVFDNMYWRVKTCNGQPSVQLKQPAESFISSSDWWKRATNKHLGILYLNKI